MNLNSFKEELRAYRFGRLTILQWMAVLALTGILLQILFSLLC